MTYCNGFCLVTSVRLNCANCNESIGLYLLKNVSFSSVNPSINAFLISKLLIVKRESSNSIPACKSIVFLTLKFLSGFKVPNHLESCNFLPNLDSNLTDHKKLSPSFLPFIIRSVLTVTSKLASSKPNLSNLYAGVLPAKFFSFFLVSSQLLYN